MELVSNQPPDDFPARPKVLLPRGVEDKYGNDIYITMGLAFYGGSVLYTYPVEGGLKTMRKNWVYRRGDIYFANLGYRKGSEQGGKRPVVVLQNNTGNRFAPTLTVVPITSILKKPNQPTHFVFYPKSTLKRPSMAMAEQTQTIDKKKIISYVGKMDDVQMQGIERAVQVHFGFSNH